MPEELLNQVDLQQVQESQQETILLELEMILATVKEIDKNLIKSIDLLSNGSSFHKNSVSEEKPLNHVGVMKQSIDNITNILRLLDSI